MEFPGHELVIAEQQDRSVPSSQHNHNSRITVLLSVVLAFRVHAKDSGVTDLLDEILHGLRKSEIRLPVDFLEIRLVSSMHSSALSDEVDHLLNRVRRHLLEGDGFLHAGQIQSPIQ